MIPNRITPKSLNDAVSNLGRIVDPPAVPPKADLKATAAAATMKPIPAADTLHVLRGVPDTAAATLLAANDDGRVYENLGNLADGDVMALAFIVMMEAAKSAREDLKSIMDGVKSINKEKQDSRSELFRHRKPD